MSTFTGVSEYYRRYRPGIPEDLATLLVEQANRDACATTLLDLGTGTGQVVEALHSCFSDIIAVDSDQEMLDAAEAYLRQLISADTALRCIHAKAEDFVPPPGWSASLVTISRAFHWMEQPLVLERLTAYVPREGVVAVFGDRSFWDADNDWKKALRAVIQSFLGEQRRSGAGVFVHHDRPYSDIMRESPFHRVEEFTIPVRRVWNVDSVLGYLYSTTFAAPWLFGGRVHEFEVAVRAALAAYSKDGLMEENEFVVRVGRKG